MDSIIQTSALTKIFHHKVIAVNNLNLDVPEGAVYGFLGPNGSGKTTTIKLILGLLKPSAGKVQVFGEQMGMDSAGLRHRIGYLPTQPKFPGKLTAMSYLDYIGRIFGLPKETRVPRYTELIRSVDLLSRSSVEIMRLSTGELTRLGIASALINDPDLLIMDEPTLGLDPLGRASTVNLIIELSKQEGKTVFVSSHILADIDRFCTHVGIINHGKLIFNGSITEIKKKIRRNTIELQVDGDAKNCIDKLKIIPGVINIEQAKHIIRISIDDPEDYSKALMDIFRLLHEEKIELISFSSGSQDLEHAFLSLLEEEKKHGFLRTTS